MKNPQFQNIPGHAHCKVCGVSMPKTRSFCSNECAATDEKGKGGFFIINQLLVTIDVPFFSPRIAPLTVSGEQRTTVVGMDDRSIILIEVISRSS